MNLRQAKGRVQGYGEILAIGRGLQDVTVSEREYKVSYRTA
ncbi:hypothetical protein [Paenibacillus sp. NPDC057934]